LLLDAIGAATEKLIITYTGANQYSGLPRPPAVPLDELLDTLDMTTTEKVRDRIVVEHPLQPFDIRNVVLGDLVPNVPFSFDPTALRAAKASAGDRHQRPAFISGPLPAQPTEDVILADLIGFFKDPVKGFFRALDFTLPRDVESVDDAMPVNLDSLEEWSVGDRILHDVLRGMTPEQAREAEWRRGTLPPGKLGWRKATEIRDQAALLANEARQYRTGDPTPYDVDIQLGGGRRLSGTVPAVYGHRLVSVTYSKLDGKHLLEAWIALLALYARHSRQDWSAACIGRRKRGTAPRVEELGRPDGDATEVLRELVAMYDAGRREPLPLPVKTSYAWAVARHSGDDPVKGAEYRWYGDFGEHGRPAHVRAWGAGARLSDLMTPLRPGEEFDSEDNRLGAYACRLWSPLLRAGRIPA
jgi:exodeoxyribonuclease V gamma subunit